MSNPFKQAQEPKPEQKPSVQATPEAKTDRSPTVLLSQTDAYIHERIKAQPKTREEIEIKIEDTFDPNHHRLTLPKELDQFKQKFAFHWIFKREQAISEACDVKGWTIVNQTHFPELPGHLFSVTGCIERGDMLLGFMPEERAKRIRTEPAKKSKLMVDARINAHKGNPDFYVPVDKTEEGEKSQVIGL